MIRVLALLGLLVASLGLAPASAQETLGDLTLYAADGKQTHAVALQSFYFALPTTPGSGDGPDRAITMTGTVNAPDPLLITC